MKKHKKIIFLNVFFYDFDMLMLGKKNLRKVYFDVFLIGMTI